MARGILPLPLGGSRLIVRERYHAHDEKTGAIITATQPVVCMVTAGMLHGIRGRTEELFSVGV